MSNFKIAVLVFFVISTIAAVVLFALYQNTSTKGSANLIVWGTVSPEVFNVAYRNSTLKDNKSIKISYVKKEQSTFDMDFVEALADGSGPDIVILREDFIYKNRNRIFTIPYSSYKERDYKDKFIDIGNLFLNSDGIVALPFIVDPMVMYWNKSMFANVFAPEPPKSWEDFTPLIEKLTKRDSSANILQSVLAMGEWRNITNAKDIISTLLLQAGTPITQRTRENLNSVLNNQFDYPVMPSLSAINFYTQFSNPNSPNYTWNRSLPSSFNMFLSGTLATYMGFASEILSIQQKNSNLNFDVTYVPQIKDTKKKTVFGHVYAMSIVKQSKQIAGAFTAIAGLTEKTAIQSIEKLTNLPPVRRDLIGSIPADAFRTVFYNSALISNAWIDPDSSASANTFRDMIESITSGRSPVSSALSKANEELNAHMK